MAAFTVKAGIYFEEMSWLSLSGISRIHILCTIKVILTEIYLFVHYVLLFCFYMNVQNAIESAEISNNLLNVLSSIKLLHKN